MFTNSIRTHSTKYNLKADSADDSADDSSLLLEAKNVEMKQSDATEPSLNIYLDDIYSFVRNFVASLVGLDCSCTMIVKWTEQFCACFSGHTCFIAESVGDPKSQESVHLAINEEQDMNVFHEII